MHGPVTAYLDRLAPRSRRTYAGDARALAGLIWNIPVPRTESDADALDWSGLGGEQGVTLCARLSASYAPSTARRMVACYRGILRECWRGGRISAEALARALDLPPIRGATLGRGRALTWAEVGRLLEAAACARDRAILAVMVGGGLRRAEVATLEQHGVSSRRGRVELRINGKGRRQRRVAMPSWAAAPLDAYMRETAPHDPGLVFGLTDSGVADVVRAAAKRAGLGVVSAHDLRRTYASLALGAGMPLASLARAMGHAKVTTTMIYDRRPDDDVLAEAGRLDTGLTSRYTGRGDA